MLTTLAQIAALFTTPPGNLAYHLGMAFTTAGALAATMFHAPALPVRASQRLVRGMVILLLLQLVLLLPNGAAGQRPAPAQFLLPAADRAVSILSLSVLIWLWAYPFYLRREKSVAVLVLLFTAAALVATLTYAAGQPPSPFNLNGMDRAWQAGMAGICLLGIWLLARHKPPAWGLGAAMLGILAAGHLAQVLLPLPAGDFPGLSRLADLAAFPFLFALPGRPLFTSQLNTRPNPFSQERRRHSTDPATLQALLDLASAPPDLDSVAISRAIAHAMIADCCFLIAPYDPSGQMTLLGGYDLIQDIPLPGMTLDATRIPALAEALRMGKPLSENLEAGAPDPNREIGSAAHFGRTGSLLFYPVLRAPGDAGGGILLFSPYSNRSWSPEDQAYLAPASASLTRLIFHKEQPPEAALPGRAASETDLVAIRSLQQALQERIEVLREENDALRSSRGVGESPPLPEEDAGSGSAGPAPQFHPEAHVAPADIQLITALVRQMRQSISAASGYSDLLSGSLPTESRQPDVPDSFAHSIRRTRFLLEGISSLLGLYPAAEISSAGWVDLPRQVDEALEFIRIPVQQKGLAVQIDLPVDLPIFKADEAAVRQILVHLLQNAAGVTPAGGSISLRARLQADEVISPVLTLQVTDGGGGVPRSDLPRVFSAEGGETRPIPGIAPDRVGLQVARALAQALGGRIWIEPAEGKSTISVLLPVVSRESELELFSP